jgi:hypothetical protein
MSDIQRIGDTIKRHTVVVESGSGVLIQPMTNEYSYILTAKHVVKHYLTSSEFGINDLGDLEIKTFNGNKLSANKIYHHDILDIAVILIDPFLDFPEMPITPYKRSISRGDDVLLYGYPKYAPEHRNESSAVSDWIETYDLSLMDSDVEQLVLRNIEVTQHADIAGFSGGGLFCSDNKGVYLIGIEHSVTKPAEFADRVVGCPVDRYNEIFKNNNLEPLKPLYLSDFKYVQDDIFIFENCFDLSRLQSITELLNYHTSKKLINCSIKPIEILQLFKDNLKVYRQCDSELEKKGLWVAFLELLAIEAILNPLETWNADYIKSLFKSYRIIYIDSTRGWKAHLEKVLSTNTSSLKPNGKILLVTGGVWPNSPDVLSELNAAVIPNIFSGLSGEAIDNAQRTYTNKTAIIHLPKLHNSCIEEKEWDYAELNRVMHESEMTDMLRTDYSKYLQTEEPDYE